MTAWLARGLVFFTSAAVLVIEILAVRILAPYLGVSLEVFTGVIGVILAGISLGAWLGGRAADRGRADRLPGPLLIAGGITAMAAPSIIDLVGPGLAVDALSIVAAAAFGFLLPAAFLSAVPPVIVKIQLGSVDQTGSVVGLFSAIGTVGAIFGTFATGFFLIGAFPTRPIVVVLGAGLVLAGVILTTTRGRWVLAIGAGIFATLVVGVSGPCEHETRYHCATIEVDPARPTGRTLYLDRLPNSYVDLENPAYLEFRYTRLIADVIGAHSRPGPLTVLSIGGGGFTLPGYLETVRPGTENVVLEIDPDLVEIATAELRLSPDVDVRVGDARNGIREIADDSIDVVIGDAYSGASVPWHLTTVEYDDEIDRVLRDGGIYAMNVIDYGQREFVRAEARTLLETFSSVALLAPETYLSGEAGGNYILAASRSPIDLTAIVESVAARGGVETGITGDDLSRFIDDAVLLDDDYAPVDQLLGRS